MSTTVKTTGFNYKKISRRIYDNPKVGIFAAETAGKLMNDFVPMKSGTLSQSYVTRPWQVEYIQPYAHYQYEGTRFNFSKELHPLATAHWDKAMMKSRGRNLLTSIQNFIDRGV